MPASAGSLVVSLGLDAAQYTQGLTKAEYQARKFGESIGSGIRIAAIASTAAIAGLATAAVAASAAFNTLLEGAGKFQDLAEETGDSAAAIASFATVADGAGVSIESVAGAMNKLTRNLTSGTKESAAAVKALGLSFSDLKKLSSADQFEAVANAFNKFGDSTDKVAIAMALFGKSGAEQLKVFKELQAEGGRTNILTTEQIKLADDYLDKQAVLTSQLKQYASAIAANFVPAVNALIGVLVNATKGFVDTKTAVNALSSGGGVQQFAENAGRALAGMVDYVTQSVKELKVLVDFVSSSAKALGQVASFDFSGAAATGKEFRDRYGLDEYGRKVAKGAGQEAGKTFVQAYNETLAAGKRSAFAAIDPRRLDLGPKKKLNAGGLASGGGGSSGSDATKNILDNQLKAYENAAKEEQDILASRNKMLDLYNSNNLISTKDYYAGKRTALDQAVSAQIAAYDQEIAALQAYQAKAGKATEREASQGKINDLIEKKSKLQRDAAQTATEMGFAEQKATEAYAASLNELNAKVLELQGNLVGAANIRFDAQNQDLLKKSLAEGNEEAVKQIGYLRDINSAQAQINKTQQDFSNQKAELQRSEESIARNQELGLTGQIEGLTKLGAARKAALAGMQKSLADLQAIQASGTQLTDAQKQSVADLTNQVKSLSTELDPLGEKFNTMFSDAAGNAFTDFINGTKTAKQAFTSFLNDIGSQLAKMAAQDVFKSLFSGGGTATGGAGFNIGSLLSSFFGHASGGLMTPGSMARVNENGPELFDYQGKQYLLNGNKNASISANDSISSGGGFSQQINFTVEGDIDRSTQTQVASKVLRQTNAASRRFA